MTAADPSPIATAIPSKWAAVALRWGKACVVASSLTLAFTESLGSTWPAVLLTPYVPQWACIATIGLLLILSTRMTGPRPWKPDHIFLAAGAVSAIYFAAVTWNAVPWRIVAPAARLADEKSLSAIKLVYANVHTGNADTRPLLQLVHDEDPDVIVLVEINSSWTRELTSLNAAYPHRRVVPDDAGNFGIGFWTRLKVVDAQLVLLKPEEPDTLYDTPQLDAMLEIELADGTRRPIHLLGLHPLPPIRPGNTRARDAVMTGAAESIIRHPDIATIVAGDLNASRYCRVVQQFARSASLHDAASTLRFSWPNTWSRWAMGIRIDHLLASDHWRVADVHQGRDIGSDHLPIVSELHLIR